MIGLRAVDAEGNFASKNRANWSLWRTGTGCPSACPGFEAHTSAPLTVSGLTEAELTDARLIEVPASTVVLILWNERAAPGEVVPYYAISPNVDASERQATRGQAA